ncbi:MAG: hypothetical protein AAB698_01850 [Patescibacteria group bacterium]
MQKETQQIQNLENLNTNYRAFYFILGLAIIGVLIFLGWSLTRGSGEQNLGSWLIFIIIPYTIKSASVFIGISLILKFAFNKIFKNQLKRPILVSVLITILVTAILGYFTNQIFLIEELLDSEGILYVSGIILIGISIILVVIFTKILKVSAPDFWRLNLAPVIITYLLVMVALPFIIGGLNYFFTKTMVCDFVYGKLPQSNCYRIKAAKTGDVGLCHEKELDQIMEGDCIIAVAVYKNDPSLCELSEIKNNNNSYKFCLSIFSVNL